MCNRTRSRSRSPLEAPDRKHDENPVTIDDGPRRTEKATARAHRRCTTDRGVMMTAFFFPTSALAIIQVAYPVAPMAGVRIYRS
jgi:hypothetical protein